MGKPGRQTVLILTVGLPGQQQDLSTRPEVVSLRALQPDFVAFLCSRPGEGHAGNARLAQQYAQIAHIDDSVIHELDDPDDLIAVYEQALAILQRLRQRFPQAKIVVDYTAGTKSMSTAIVLATLDLDDPDIELRLVQGPRGEHATVIPGTESFRPVSRVYDVRARRLLALARTALERFDYDEADQTLTKALESPISPQLHNAIEKARNLIRGFDAWDRYELQRAQRILEPYRMEWHAQLTVLQSIQGVVAAFDSTKRQESGTDHPTIAIAPVRQVKDPYVAVDDLLYNAERRAAQGRFDDAIARIYRALELLAQIRLATAYAIQTSNVDLTRVPEQMRDHLQRRQNSNDATIKIGLTESWRLLAAYPDEPLSPWFSVNEGKIKHFLVYRNSSLFAHGFTPISATMWEDIGKIGLALCREALAQLTAHSHLKRLQHQQFPSTTLLDPVYALLS